MIFEEIEPNENFDLRRFRSVPFGRWEAGIIRMLWGKHRVRLAPAQSDGWVPIDYWGGSRKEAQLLLGYVCGICIHLPESISEKELVKIFPHQNDKDLGAGFFAALRQAGEFVRTKYKATGND